MAVSQIGIAFMFVLVPPHYSVSVIKIMGCLPGMCQILHVCQTLMVSEVLFDETGSELYLSLLEVQDERASLHPRQRRKLYVTTEVLTDDELRLCFRMNRQ